MWKSILGLVLALGLVWLLLARDVPSRAGSAVEQAVASPVDPSQPGTSVAPGADGSRHPAATGPVPTRSPAIPAKRAKVLDALTGQPIPNPSWDLQETPEGPAWRVSALHYESATVLSAAVQGLKPQSVLLHPTGSVSLRIQAHESLRNQAVRIQLKSVALARGKKLVHGIPTSPLREHLVVLDKQGMGHLETVAVGEWVARAPGLTLLGSSHAADPGYQQVGESAVRITGLPVDGDTGAFSVEHGKDVLVELSLCAGSYVMGELALRSTSSIQDCAIELFSHRALMSDGFPKISNIVGRLRGKNLKFEFPGLQPGRYQINAVVATYGDEIHLFTQRFELHEAERKDLGILYTARHEHQVIVETVDGVTRQANDLLQAWIGSRQRVMANVHGFRPDMWSWNFTVSPRGTTRVIGIPDMSRFSLDIDSLVICPEGESPVLEFLDGARSMDDEIVAEVRRTLGLPENLKIGRDYIADVKEGSQVRAFIPCLWKRELRVRVLHPGVSTGGKLKYLLHSDGSTGTHSAKLTAGSTETELLIEITHEKALKQFAAWIPTEAGLQTHGAWEPKEGLLIWSLTPGLEIPVRSKRGRASEELTAYEQPLRVRIPGVERPYHVRCIIQSSGSVAFVGIPPGCQVAYGSDDAPFQPVEQLLGGIEVE